MKWNYRTSVFMLAWGVVIPSISHSATLYMRDGEIFGKILSQTPQNYSVKVNCHGTPVNVPKSSVIRVDYSTPCSTPSPPKAGSPPH